MSMAAATRTLEVRQLLGMLPLKHLTLHCCHCSKAFHQRQVLNAASALPSRCLPWTCAVEEGSCSLQDEASASSAAGCCSK